MTVSITPCLKNWTRYILVLLLSFACLGRAAFAAEIDIKNAQLTSGEEGMSLSADFGIELNSRLEDAVARGLVLHFVAEFELNRPRWYWFDDTAANKTLTYQLSYHALTRQYRLSRGALHQSFPDLASALKVLSRLRNWVVIEKAAERSQFKPGEIYQASLRFRLDISQLPKPFQITALANKEWTLSSDWLRWQVQAPADSK